jgi:hypothetical protein
VWKKCIGTPEEQIHPTSETLERLIWLAEEAKQAYDGMVQVGTQLAGEEYGAALGEWVKVSEEMKEFVFGTTGLTTKSREEYRRLKEGEKKAYDRFEEARKEYFSLLEEWSKKHPTQ